MSKDCTSASGAGARQQKCYNCSELVSICHNLGMAAFMTVNSCRIHQGHISRDCQKPPKKTCVSQNCYSVPFAKNLTTFSSIIVARRATSLGIVQMMLAPMRGLLKIELWWCISLLSDLQRILVNWHVLPS